MPLFLVNYFQFRNLSNTYFLKFSQTASPFNAIHKLLLSAKPVIMTASNCDILMQHYSSNGTAVGSPVQIDDMTGYLDDPAIAL